MVKEKKQSIRKMDKRKSLKVVTDNDLITAQGLSDLSINARKLLYLTVAQCRQKDKEFYTYQISPNELASLFGVSKQRMYDVADEITDELMHISIRIDNKNGFEKYNLCSICKYIDYILEIKLNREMAELLLDLDKNFSQPKLWDFLRMRSTYSMDVWHLMQREMGSKTPNLHQTIEFELTLEELRRVTGTENKFKQISEFKRCVFDKAIREIRDNGLADISYVNKKKGRKVTGFACTAQNVFELQLNLQDQELSLEERKNRRYMKLHARELRKEKLTEEERRELEELAYELDKYED